jgi:mRNA-degrading endonuclease RelE of RelBE toxin-antitoxin system
MYRILYTREARRNIAKLPLDKKRQIKNSVERIAANKAPKAQPGPEKVERRK